MYLRLSPYREILQGVLTDLEVNEGIIKITGKSGAGKTALCSQLYRDLESNGQQAVFFLAPPASATALQNSILESLKLDTTGNFTKTLTAWLRARSSDRKPLVLIFDDAQQLDHQTFGAIRMLCNIQDGARALIRVILCGSEELDQKLATPALRAVTQFLSQSITLPYLTRDHVNDFCQGYWLAMASDMKPLPEKALQKLFSETQGHPGILQVRLNHGTTGAEKLERSSDAAQADTAGHRPRKYGGRRPGWIPAVLILAGLAVGGYLILYQVAPQIEIEPAVENVTAPATPPPQAVSEPAATTAIAEALPAPAAELPDPTPAAPEAAESVEQLVDAAAPPAAEPEGIGASELPPVATFIAAWAGSWQARDVEAYLAHYHPEFTPPPNLTLTEWQDQRRRVIGNAGELAISVDPPEFTANLQGGTRIVRFWLHYSSASYADRTLKEILLAPLDGNWRILAENNMRTERE